MIDKPIILLIYLVKVLQVTCQRVFFENYYVIAILMRYIACAVSKKIERFTYTFAALFSTVFDDRFDFRASSTEAGGGIFLWLISDLNYNSEFITNVQFYLKAR